MLTVKIVNVSTKDEFLVEASKCVVEKAIASTFNEWEKDIFQQTVGKLVVTAPEKEAKNIAYWRIKIINDGEICIYFACNSNVFVMNEQGQTVAIYRK